MHVPNPVDLVLKKKRNKKTRLVGGWPNPSEKYDRQIGSFFQVGMKINKYLKPPGRLPIWLGTLVGAGFFFPLTLWALPFLPILWAETTNSHQPLATQFRRSGHHSKFLIPKHPGINYMPKLIGFFTSTKKTCFFSTSWISTLPNPGCWLGQPPQDDARILGSRIRNSKVVSTHRTGTHPEQP